MSDQTFETERYRYMPNCIASPIDLILYPGDKFPHYSGIFAKSQREMCVTSVALYKEGSEEGDMLGFNKETLSLISASLDFCLNGCTCSQGRNVSLESLEDSDLERVAERIARNTGYAKEGIISELTEIRTLELKLRGEIGNYRKTIFKPNF